MPTRRGPQIEGDELLICSRAERCGCGVLLGEAVRGSGARGDTDWTVQWAETWLGRDEYGGGKREREQQLW